MDIGLTSLRKIAPSGDTYGDESSSVLSGSL